MTLFKYNIYWVSIVDADVLVLKHQAISNHNIDQHQKNSDRIMG